MCIDGHTPGALLLHAHRDFCMFSASCNCSATGIMLSEQACLEDADFRYTHLMPAS